jgi:predicted TIM-barrel fold metal-dependent hydrolase
MRVIALEEHFETKMYADAAPSFFGAGDRNPYMEAIRGKLVDVGEQRLADMDEGGVDFQVLSLSGILLDALDPATATAIAYDANDFAAERIKAHPTRFSAFAALGMKEPEKAANELRRCVRELGFPGGIVNGTTDGAFLDDARFTPVLEAAQELNVPIYLHPAPPPAAVREAYYSGLPDDLGQALSIAGWGWHVETGLHALRMMASGVFDRLPDLQIIIGHMGENLPFSIARSDSVLSRQAKLKRPIIEYFRSNFHVTTSGFFTVPPFLCALMVIGADRLLFSVDYPFSSNKTARAFMDSLPISTEDKEKISHGNAERLLKV